MVCPISALSSFIQTRRTFRYSPVIALTRIAPRQPLVFICTASSIQLIERHLNPKLRVSTILLTMYDSRTNLAHQVAADVREHFPDEVLDTIIPRSVRISEAPSYGQSVISYDTNSSGSLSYMEAAAEIARRGVPR